MIQGVADFLKLSGIPVWSQVGSLVSAIDNVRHGRGWAAIADVVGAIPGARLFSKIPVVGGAANAVVSGAGSLVTRATGREIGHATGWLIRAGEVLMTNAK